MLRDRELPVDRHTEHFKRAILVITGTGISTARRLLGCTKTISTDLLKLSTKLFSAAHSSIYDISATLELILLAGTTRYESSAYLCMELPGVTGADQKL